MHARFPLPAPTGVAPGSVCCVYNGFRTFSHPSSCKCAPLSHRIATFEAARAEVRSRGVQHLILPLLRASWPLQKCRKRKDHSLKKFSGPRLARQEAQHAVSPVFYRSNWPLASKKPSFYSNFRRVPRGPREGPKRPLRTHAHTCSHMLTHAHTCSRMLTHAHTCWSCT